MFLRLIPLALLANGILGTPIYLLLGDAKGALSAFVLGALGLIAIIAMGPRRGRKRST